jgi:Ca2+-binding EF-hand superfamily protein
MNTKSLLCALAIALLGFALNSKAAEDPKAEFDRRAAERYVSLFQALDLNNDAMVSKAEAQADLNFGPAFDDMDINRDGFVTAAELQRFIEQRYGMLVQFRR